MLTANPTEDDGSRHVVLAVVPTDTLNHQVADTADVDGAVNHVAMDGEVHHIEQEVDGVVPAVHILVQLAGVQPTDIGNVWAERADAGFGVIELPLGKEDATREVSLPSQPPVMQGSLFG
jgi:hypothetical protein